MLRRRTECEACGILSILEDDRAGRSGLDRAQAHLEPPGKLALGSWVLPHGERSQPIRSCRFHYTKKMFHLAGEGCLTVGGALKESRALSLAEAIPVPRHSQWWCLSGVGRPPAWQVRAAAAPEDARATHRQSLGLLALRGRAPPHTCSQCSPNPVLPPPCDLRPGRLAGGTLPSMYGSWFTHNSGGLDPVCILPCAQFPFPTNSPWGPIRPVSHGPRSWEWPSPCQSGLGDDVADYWLRCKSDAL